MSAPAAAPPARLADVADGPSPSVRLLADRRPPARTWSGARVGVPDQPTLLFEAEPAPLSGPRASGHRVHVVGRSGDDRVVAGLPDVKGWSASLALALAEVLHGRRPLGQLSRWADERVLATLQVSLRRRATGGPSRPVQLHSVHLQFPQPRAVEVAAHVHAGGPSLALAFRLDAWYDRWLCTALELGPRDQQV